MATHVHVVLQGAKALLPSSTNHVRHYGLKHKISKQERHDLAEYGRKLTVLRKQFRQEWLEKKKKTEEATSVQAAEEAAMERHLEERSLEQNRIENERMKQRRESKLIERSAKLLGIREEGEITRITMETNKLEERIAEVQKTIDSSNEFITFDNLDLKVEEAVKNEQNLKFRLNVDGEKIF